MSLKKRNSSQKFIFEQLEPRLLLSADLDPASLGAALPVDTIEQVSTVVETGLDPSTLEYSSAAVNQCSNEIFFVDSNILDHEQLVDDLLASVGGDRQAEVVTLDDDSSGIEQISAILSQRQGIDTVHIISHGTDGAVKLGNAWLTADTIADYSDAIAGWQDALTSEADLLLYGCDLAAGVEGRALVNSLASLTGTDVAASEDPTGSSELGGDWILEVNRGEIDAGFAFSSGMELSWTGLLNTYDVTVTSDGGPGSLRQAIINANTNPGPDTINLTVSGTYDLSIAESGGPEGQTGDLDIIDDLDIFNTSGGPVIIDATNLPGDHIFEIDNAATVTMDNITIQDGTGFSAMYINVGSDVTLTNIEFLNNTGGGSGGAIWNNGTLNVSSSLFSGNSANQGGAIDNDGTLIMTDAVFDGNSANAGGALHNQNNATLTDIKIVNGSAMRGGGIWNGGGSASMTLDNVSITDNTVTKQGGGIYTSQPITATNVTIAFNSATDFDADGGGVFIPGGAGDLTLTNSIIANNSSPTNPNANVALSSGGNNISGEPGILFGPGDIDADPELELVLDPSDLVHEFQDTSPYEGSGIGAFSEANAKPTTIGIGDVTVAEDASDTIIDLSTAFADIEDATLTYSVETNTDTGLVTTSVAGDNLTLDYVDDQNGIADITVRATDSGGLFEEDTFRVTVNPINDPPVVATNNGITVPEGSTGTVIDNTMLNEGDPDDSGIGLTYTVTSVPGNGVLKLSGTPLVNGNTFTQDDIDNNRITYDHDGSETLSDSFEFDLADGETSLTNQTFDITVTPVTDLEALWFTTRGDVTGGGPPGLPSWNTYNIIQLGDDVPTPLEFEPNAGITNGSFANVFDISDFTSGTPSITGMHYVSRNLTVGTAPNEFVLQAGDLLLSLDVDSKVLTGSEAITSITANAQDVFVFRPQTPGDYSKGQFYFLLDNPIGIGGDSIEALSLVESDTTVGGTNITAGSFLLSRFNATHDDKIYLFDPTTAGRVGESNTLGSLDILIQGGGPGDGSMNGLDGIVGLDLIESNMTIGGAPLQAGDILVALYNDQTVGGQDFLREDMFYIRMTETLIDPLPNQSNGAATLFFEGLDVNLDSTDGFESINSLTLAMKPAANNAPTITAIGDQIIPEDGTTGALAFTIGDTETAAASLTVTASSSDTAIIPNANLVLGGSDANRTITVSPTANQNGGPVTITVTVNDGTSTTNTTFDVTVTPENDDPTITAIADQTIAEDGTTGALAFTIGDAETAAGSLSVSASSSDTAIIPNANLVLGGSGANRTITVDPATNQNGGPVTISVTVDDGTTTTDTTFTVTVTAVNDDPYNNGGLPTDVTVIQETPSSINLSLIDLADPDAGSGNLTVTLTTSAGGTLTAISGGGVTPSGSGTAAITLTGSLINLNTYLDTVSNTKYTGPLALAGDNVDTIAVSVVDNGNTGSGGGAPVNLGSVNVDIVVASQLVVNTVADTKDGDTSSIAAFLADNPDGLISLREAIEATNGTPGFDIINFNIGGGGLQTIQPGLGGLPDITDPVFIDGTSQPGYAGAPIIVIDGTNAGFTSGITITAGGSTIKGLVINNFGDDGIDLLTNGGNTIIGNYIGTDPSGNFAQGNGFNGIWITGGSSDNIIGGTNPGDGNLISGNWDEGVEIEGSTSSGNIIQGNLIGTDVSGLNALPNLGSGILIQSAPDNLIGGNVVEARNIISGNDFEGIRIGGADAYDNQILGNYIGVDKDGSNNLGNRYEGVWLSSGAEGTPGNPYDNIIGGINSGEGNIIAHNGWGGPGWAGIQVSAGSGNSLRGNSIFSNDTLGIDIGAFGVNANDANDTDGGANLRQNYPVLDYAMTSGTEITISGTISSTDSTSLYIDFYTNSGADASGYGQGQIYLGSTTVITNGSGDGSFTATFTATVPVGQFVSATATDPTGNTSEFCQNVVTALNNDPTITAIADQTIAEDGTTGALAFTIGDVETAASLVVTASSSDTAIIPNANLVLGGSGANRTITVSPAANQNGGPVTITVTVNDGTTTTDETFTVTVTPDNDAPTITNIANQTIAEDGNTGALAFTIGDVETAAGSLTVTASSSDTAIIPDANLVLGGSGANRTITVSPAANQNGGPVTITVTVDDGTTTTDETFTVTVTPDNDAPTITNIANQTIAEDGTTGVLAFTIGDVETAAGSLTVTASSSDTAIIPNGNLVLGGSGASRTITVTPAANQNGGPVTITVTVNDGTTTTNTTFDVTVTPDNDDPTITTIGDQTIPEDGSTGALAFTIGDAETAAASLVVTASSDDTTIIPNANLVLGGSGANRTITVSPAANQTGGLVTITVTVNDGTTTANTTFDVTVTPENDDPTITAIADQTILEDGTTGALSFIIGDVETTAASLVVTASSSDTAIIPDTNLVLGGSGANRTITVSPAANQTGGPVTITVTVNDGTTTANTTFDVTVTPENDDPTITAIADQTIAEDGTTGTLAFTIGDTETPAASLTVTASSSDTAIIPNANLVLGGSGANRTITVSPAANQNGGPVTITVTVNDGTTSTDTTFDITITADNDPPTTTGLADVTVDEDAPNTVINLSSAFTDAEDAVLTYTVTTNSNGGLVTTAVTGNNLTIDYVADQFGTADITIKATDSDGLFVEDSFRITVNPVNDQPTTTGLANVAVDEDAPDTVMDLASAFSDIEDVTLTYTVTGNTNSGLVNTSVAGSNLTLDYVADQSGIADITVRAMDSGGLFVEDTFSVNVNFVNTPPTTTGLTDVTVNEDAPNTIINLSSAFADAEDAVLTYTVTSNSNGGLVTTAVVGSSLTLDYGTNQFGTADITVRATDSGGLFVEDTFRVTVNPVNDAPTGVNLNTPETYTEDTPLNLADIVVSDVDGGNLTATLTLSDPVAGVLSTGSSGGVTSTYDQGSGRWQASGSVNSINTLLAQVIFTPVADSFADFSITVNVNDGITSPITGIKAITGLPVGDTPQVGDITTDRTTQSGLIKIKPNENDGAEVTHFRIAGIHGGTLYLANGTTPINNGEYITVAQGQAGVRFTPLSTAEDTDGGFQVESSQNGVSVAAQSGAAPSLVTVTEIEINSNEIIDDTPEPTLDSETDNPSLDDSDDTPAEDTPEPEGEEVEQIAEETFDSRDEGDFDEAAAEQEQTVTTSPLKLGLPTSSITFSPLEIASLSPDFFNERNEANRTLVTDRLRSSTTAQKIAYRSEINWGVDYKMTSILLQTTFDAMEQETAREIKLEKTIIGSAIATTTTLSVGYVVWLVRSGMLLSSLLSSLPAWQIADPLPILAKLKDDEDKDDESLEEIVGDGDTEQEEESIYDTKKDTPTLS